MRRRSIAAAVAAAALAVPAIGRALDAGGSIRAPATASAGAVRGQQFLEIPEAVPGTTVSMTIGTSAGGRPIEALRRVGSPTTARTVLAIGSIHGDERAGEAVIARLAGVPLPDDLDLWWVPTLNPDGAASGRHGNANGVDLNRNWPANWRPPGGAQTSGSHSSGPSPASEPETQAMMRFIAQIDPDVTVWFHQPWGTVDCNVPRVGAVCGAYAAAVGMGVSFADRPGTATDWIMTAGHGVSFVVELGYGALSASSVDRHVSALATLNPT